MNSDYNSQQLMVVATSREIRDWEIIFAGVGIPCLGAQVAIVTHAPNSEIVTECGVFGSRARRIMLGIGDNACGERAKSQGALWRAFSDQQSGYYDVGMLGGAQVDKYGNLNSTVIIGGKSYRDPITRLPGSGGANDIASSAGRTVIMMRQEKRRFLERVDYITSPGYLDGGDARKRIGLLGGGPSAVISDKAVFRFDKVTKEMFLSSVHPGVTVDDVKREVSWDLKVAPDVGKTPPPSDRELEIIRTLDPLGIYTGTGLKGLTFDAYIRMLEESFDRMDKLYNSHSS